ncbi:MAG: ATP-binding protein [Gammaproteobacteria bacterium]
MSLPAPVSEYLISLVAHRAQPLTLCVDQQWRLRQMWGDAKTPGFAPITAGDDVRNAVPCLFGQRASDKFVLPMVELRGAHVFHVHNLPAGDVSFVLLLPADAERDSRRSLQQKANEVRLLNHRQQRLVEQLSAAKQKLEIREQELTRANEIKARFIAGMSHEFRTPLTAVLGYAELIDERAKGDTDVEAHSRSVGRAARHLLSMVDNILDQARLEEGDVLVNRTEFDLRELIDDLASIMAPLAAARFLGFAAFVANDVPARLNTDAVRLRQVLLNLLGNAVKFTETGSVRMEADWQNNELVFRVIDSGPGIAEEDQARIFEEFQRGRDSDKVRGVGLGLNIASRLSELLGGRIVVKSALGQGSEFTVFLPGSIAVDQTAAPQPILPAPVPSDAFRGSRILVAEDDPDIIDLVQIILGRANYDVDIAMNGRDAVDRALEINPDLVLMDVNMPLMTGMEAASEMRKRGIECPIIALSASLGADDRDGALEAGYDTYLVKPIARADLLAAIEAHLEKAL